MLAYCNSLRFVSQRAIINLTVVRAQSTNNSNNSRDDQRRTTTTTRIRPRPPSFHGVKLTGFEVSKNDFKFVEKLLPTEIVPEPPVHTSYPTPSGWIPIDVNKAQQWPYQVLRTRFHNYPIYREEREGSRKLVRVRNIQGDIWKFDKDLREYIEKRIEIDENKANFKIVTSVNEVQRQVLIKGFYENYVSDFLKEKGF